MSLIPPEVAAAMQRILNPGATWPTPGDLARHLNPRIRQTPALDLIDTELARLINTPDGRLVISMPPQEGKSQRVSRAFPLWALLRNPDTRIAIASYEHGVARRWGRAIRDDLTTHRLGLRIRDDLSAQHEWQLSGREGGVYSVGIGAALTGRPVDCVSGDVQIESEHGTLTAAEAFTRGITRIRAYDHTTGRAVWRRVEAARRIPGRRVIDITTQSGRVLTCTPDHCVYTRRGYVPAQDLRHGDTLVAVVAPSRMPVRQSASGAEDGRTESNPPQAEPLLLTGLHGRHVLGSEPDAVLPLRGTSPAQPRTDMLPRVPTGEALEDAPVESVPAVSGRVPAEIITDGVLLASLRERGTLAAHDRQGQLAFQAGHELRTVVPIDAAADLGTRWEPVRYVRGQSHDHVHTGHPDGSQVSVGHSPHQRGRVGQPSAEPHHALPDMSRGASQVEADTVAVVRSRGDEEVSVYDFQVEGTRNFFANGVLVHNCLIIDDPIKDRQQADSKTFRDRVWDWWTEVGATRLAPGAPVALVLTRWHEDDLAGRLLAAEDGHLWRVVNIPAQCDNPDTDPLGRQVGEFMESARGRTQQQWEAIKTRSGPRTWASLYQGRPAPSEGALFRRDAWQRYDRQPWLESDGVRMVNGGDRLIQSWDLSFKGSKTADWVVGQVWWQRGAEYWLLDQMRGRWGFSDTCERIRAMSARWPQTTAKLVEDKANGPAVIDALRRTVPGLVPVNPAGGKESRAAAVEPFVAAGNVHLPASHLAPWVDDLIEEAAAFPNAAHDDQCDALSQALTYLGVTQSQRRVGTGFWNIG